MHKFINFMDMQQEKAKESYKTKTDLSVCG